MPDKNEGEPPPLPEDLGSGGGVFALRPFYGLVLLFGGGILPFTLRGGPLVLRGGKELRTTLSELFGIGGGIGGELGAETPPFPVACCKSLCLHSIHSFSESSRRTVAFR